MLHEQHENREVPQWGWVRGGSVSRCEWREVVGTKIMNTPEVPSPVPDIVGKCSLLTVAVISPFIKYLSFFRHCAQNFPSIILNPYHIPTLSKVRFSDLPNARLFQNLYLLLVCIAPS